MNGKSRHIHRQLFTVLCLSILAGGTRPTNASTPEAGISRLFKTTLDLFSVQPMNPLQSYQWSGSGSFSWLAGSSGGYSVNLGLTDSTRSFRVKTHGKASQDRFIISVDIRPDKRDNLTEQRTVEVDLTDLEAKGLVIATNEDGRKYILNLTPSVKIVDNRPKRLDDTSFDLKRWAFDKSIVIFNDTLYAGQVNSSGGPLASVAYPGVAKVAFALEPFRDATPSGTLRKGRIQIRSESGQSLEIYGVRNGAHSIQVPGGPYQLWVRWTPFPEEKLGPALSLEEWKRSVRITTTEKDAPAPTEEDFAKAYKAYQKWQNSGGGKGLTTTVGPIGPKDRLDP